MSAPQYESGPTSNDLLRNLIAKHAQAALNYQINVQSVDGEQMFENAATVSTGTDYSWETPMSKGGISPSHSESCSEDPNCS